MDLIGIVTAVHRYPVKSLRGESMPSANLRLTGIEGDRQYAFLRANNTSRFPWLTGREVSALVTYTARYVEPDNPRQSKVWVATENGEYDIHDPDLLARLSREAGEEIRVLQVGRGTFDSMPVSVLSTATLDQVSAECGQALDARRFRANIVIEPEKGGAREMDWIGKTLVFGKAGSPARLRVVAPIDRCVMVTIDPDSAMRDPKILRHVAQSFNNEIAAHCTVDGIGKIEVGEQVYAMA